MREDLFFSQIELDQKKSFGRKRKFFEKINQLKSEK
jgi:hypothetical protein